MRRLLSLVVLGIFSWQCFAEKTVREVRREQRRLLRDLPNAGLVYRFKSAPNNWTNVNPLNVQSLFLTKVYIIFPHEPSSFDQVVWRNVMAVGLKKHNKYADVLFVDRFSKTGTLSVDMIYASLPSRVSPTDIHCLGVGFGANLCALLGNRFVSSNSSAIGRLTALDPIGQMSQELVGNNPDLQSTMNFDYIDVAKFVDVIHTSFLGTKELIGDVDIFVNSAIVQPECLPLNLATEIIKVCHDQKLHCPPMEHLHSCAFSGSCPKGLIEELDETIRSTPAYAVEAESRYSQDLYQMFRPSQERAALLYASALAPYINCPVCKPNLNIKMCPCSEAVLAANYEDCPQTCEKPETFGLKINEEASGTYHLGTSGWWPYFACVTDVELENMNKISTNETSAN